MTVVDPSKRRARSRITLGAVITRARRARGLDQQELAAQIGLSNSQLSRIENDHVAPRLSTVRLLADALDLDYVELLKLQN